MIETEGREPVHRLGFILVPEFSMIAFASAVEPMRLANLVTDQTHYAWKVLSTDGAPVTASNNIEVAVEGDLESAGPLESVFVCCGVGVEDYASKPLLAWLRRRAAHGTGIGALCSGAYILARAGLLDDHQCTVHWENAAAFNEEFPEIALTSELFEIDRSRYTCAGGTAAIDMMLHLIVAHVGSDIAALVSDELIHHRIREGGESQRMALRSRIGVTHPKLLAVVERMEENLENPINCADLAAECGLSARQLERLFRKYLGVAPTRYYLRLRLNRSRFLLRQTSLPILGVAMASGFISASHFSKCYREYFSCTPSDERRARLAAVS